MVLKKLTVFLGYTCNNNCLFCYSGGGSSPNMTETEAQDMLRLGRKRRCTYIEFNGGEPTIRKDLPDLLAFAKQIGYDTISVTTNGRMLYYKEFAEQLVDSGLNHITISIHGHNAELHDYLTKVKGSYSQTTRAIRNMKTIDPDIHVRTSTVITRHNYRFLPEIARNNVNAGANSCEFIFFAPVEGTERNYENITPSLKELGPFIGKTISLCDKGWVGRFMFRHVPFCYVLNPAKHSTEYITKERIKEYCVYPGSGNQKNRLNPDKCKKVKGRQCRVCRYNKLCKGIFREYAKHHGFEELIPI